ncbi:hypothetical protein M0D69_13975 [Caballeronia sp. SEWSISQ10-4 2]|uniref:hypothetical protein n=1 Tax=Caballeronia sp. SEWSISQ10-4 2 TaxID=2937438 RepID=UPI002653BA0F|nr:hypothetical protein [Caballeronia sp. SEWSISQ10-4 2]MDN7179102.1 hypothetical protein [Caballeronia sp. SEWSISQ10-4 2]
MKIECTIQRKDGTIVELSGRPYHFKPSADDPRHVAEVTDEAHIERLLSIREAYRILRTPGAAAVSETLEPADDAPLPLIDEDSREPIKIGDAYIASADSFPQFFEIHAVRYGLLDVAHRAFLDSGLTIEDWNGLDDEHRAVKIEMVLDALDAKEIAIERLKPVDPPANPVHEAPPVKRDVKEDLPSHTELNERADLDSAYRKAFGKLPPSNMKIETLRIKLADYAKGQKSAEE